MGAFFQALGNSIKTLFTSVVQCALMLATAVLLAHVGTVYTVWLTFVITEILVAGLAAFLMRGVSKNTIASIPDKGTVII